MLKILLATPAYGGQVTEAYFQSVLALMHSAQVKGVQVDVMTLVNESLITRARNDILATFMAGDWTHLLWVDADIRFDPEHVWRVLESGHGVCATGYAMKGFDWSRMVQEGFDEPSMRRASVLSVVNPVPGAEVVDGFVPVLDAGTGFMAVAREVFEQMINAHPELAYVKDGTDQVRWALFDTEIRGGRYLSEDYLFCRRWQDLGGTVWLDVGAPSTLGHRGSYTFGE